MTLKFNFLGHLGGPFCVEKQTFSNKTNKVSVKYFFLSAPAFYSLFSVEGKHDLEMLRQHLGVEVLKA